MVWDGVTCIREYYLHANTIFLFCMDVEVYYGGKCVRDCAIPELERFGYPSKYFFSIHML